MMKIWRQHNDRSKSAGDSSKRRTSPVWSYLLHGLAGVVLLPGCAWVRAQAQHRSEKCGELCSKAAEARQAGRCDRADALLDEALKKSPHDYETQHQLADSLWEAGRKQQSLEILRRLKQSYPQDARLAISLAERLAAAGQNSDALECLQPALTAEPTATAALELKAKIEANQGDLDAALASYQRLCHQKTVSVDTYLRMGRLYLRRQQPDRAAPLFRIALVDPHASSAEQLEAQWQLGVAYSQAERWSEAADQLEHVVERRDMSADDWHTLAAVEYQTGNALAAGNAIQRALALNPQHAPSRELGAALARNQPPGVNGALSRVAPVGFQNVQRH